MRPDERKWRGRPAAWVLGVLFVLFVLSGRVAAFYVDVMWFRDVGQEGVYWTSLLSWMATGLVFGLTAFAILYVNVLVARRMAPTVSVTPDPTDPDLDPREQIEAGLARAREATRPYLGWIAIGVCALLAWGAGVGAAADWDTLRLALAQVPFGTTDAQFGRDVGFFVFTLPALRIVADWLFGVLVTALFVTAAIHLIDGAIRLGKSLVDFAPHVKAHLSVLAGLLVASKAFDYWLSIYELDFSERGQVSGASYTDVNAQIPAYVILIVVALACAAALLLNIRARGWRLPVIALGVWIAASVLVGGIYPEAVQQFTVTPNELAAERPYIKRNIAATRAAFDLDGIGERQFPAAYDLTARDLVEATATMANVRLWDPNVVADSYKQLQEIRNYYDFNDVDVDRYTVGGVRRQTLVSVREMNLEQLPDQARTWLNRHLVYTHGYGMVMSPVNEVSADGLPRFIIKDIPPKSSAEVTISRPGVYFGEESNTYAIVRTDQKEFDYPKGRTNSTAEYTGGNGVAVGGLLARIAFALEYDDVEIVLSKAITSGSRILYRRAIVDRVKRLAPWLWLDADPYPVVTKDGRIVWVLDGYTWSRTYPYSQRYLGEDRVNYVRNSVKVTVDAYDGRTTLYAFDERDPVLKAWRRIFPGLVRPRSELPADIVSHLRYPEDLFRLQAEVYSTYHMLDPQVF